MRRLMMLASLALACTTEPRTPNDDAGLAMDAGSADSGGPPSGFDDCDLGLESESEIAEHGDARDYLVELGRGDTRVNLARLFVDWGVGESKILGNGGVALRRGGVEVCVTDTSRLGYENSHHNWIDAAEVTADGVRYRLELTLDWQGAGGWKYELFGFDVQNDAMLFGPERLDLLSGPKFP